MSVDPDGTNRIISQQIKEWHAFREGERTARLLDAVDTPPRVQHRSLHELATRTASTIVRPFAAVRHRLANRSIV
jgi:hypothetical protein